MTYERTVRRVPLSDPVNAVMTWPVATVEVTASIAEVSRELAADEIGAVLVLHDGVLVGVVSERDVATQVGAGRAATGLTAGDVMSTDVVTVPPDAPILEAARIMREAEVRHLPVVADGQIAGVLSMRDLFHLMLELGETGDHDPAPPTVEVEMTWRDYHRAVWLLTCPLCGRGAPGGDGFGS